jgi:hypothetical protein
LRTGRPRGRRTGPHGVRGLAEVLERKVARYWFSAPGKPFRRHSGVPFRTAGRKPSPTTSPLLASRASSGRAPEVAADHADRLHPPGLLSPSALAA